MNDEGLYVKYVEDSLMTHSIIGSQVIVKDGAATVVIHNRGLIEYSRRVAFEMDCGTFEVDIEVEWGPFFNPPNHDPQEIEENAKSIAMMFVVPLYNIDIPAVQDAKEMIVARFGRPEGIVPEDMIAPLLRSSEPPPEIVHVEFAPPQPEEAT